MYILFRLKTNFKFVFLFSVLFFISKPLFAQILNIDSLINSAKPDEPVKKKKHRTGSLYISWGYNTEWYSRSTVHIDQSALGNSYDLIHVNAHDHRGWDEHVVTVPVTIPQYNYRIGYYFNRKQDMGIEINFDHTKYLIANNQYIHLQGTRNGKPADENIYFSEQYGFYYFLNNGANFFLFNFVKRFELYRSRLNRTSLDFVAKAGVGPLIPHVQNSLFTQANTPQFQFGGWNTGAETVIRLTVMRYAFLEFSQKVDYARYSNLEVYKGTAKQNFGTYELILSGGVIFPTTKKNRYFTENVEKQFGRF